MTSPTLLEEELQMSSIQKIEAGSFRSIKDD